MKFVIFFVVATCAWAAKLPGGTHEHVRTLQDDREGPVGPDYRFFYELDNGVRMEETGSAGLAGQSVVRGSYSYISPEGETINVQYVADENGFQPESDAIPPTPPHVNELLKIADEQRAQGIQFDERGFEV